MTVSLNELKTALNELLRPEQFSDYCPNGLQVEGRTKISKLVTGVTACKALIDAAAAEQADALLVHHGYFWRGEDPSVVGIKKDRIKSLLNLDISLFAYHLPLDAHRDLGNNAQLAKMLEFETTGELGRQNNHPIGLTGKLKSPSSFQEFEKHLSDKLARPPLAIVGHSEKIETVAWCTGAAQNYIELAVDAGVDAYITGEASEQTVHIARETGLHFFAAGHHATERYGVQAVGNYLAEKLSIQHQFIDIDNPV